MIRMLIGDCRETLRSLPAGSVQTCVTSPPYFGLRDYGHEGQIGLEQTPEAFVGELVAVFREVRRVLRDDGTLWLNLGDSYAMSTKGAGGVGKQQTNVGSVLADRSWRIPDGLKPKDLIGIPWMTAKALQASYYAGRIKRDRDRAWIAAMIDGEGTICGFHHVRSDGAPRTGAHVTITNSDTLLLDEAHRIWPASRSEHQRPGAGHLGTRMTWRWIVHGAENKMLFLREVYPYLVSKRRQALVAYNLLLMMPDAKSVGHSPARDTAREKRAALVQMLTDLNQRRSIDLPTWLIEPPSCHEPGWYLRQDIIWHKPNPMPESVTDRCTKAHEYVFLLSKSERYFFDADAIKEPAIHSGRVVKATGAESKNAQAGFGSDTKKGFTERDTHVGDARNRRSVWTITTKPFTGAHFATFPPDLVEPCILAGSKPGDTVLDPFGGAGTTGLVADRLGRRAILCELNPEYAAMARDRIAHEAGMFSQIIAENVA